MNNVFISFILPVYNVEKYLNDCIESILGQKVAAPFEIILVDDGSQDSSPDLCDLWASRDFRVQAIHQDNQGLSAARNTGVRAAAGDYIWFLDSDDLLVSGAFERVVRYLSHKQADILYGRFDMMSDDGAIFIREPSDCYYPKDILISPYDTLKLLVESKLTNHIWRMVIRRSLFESEGLQFPVGRVYEDVAVTYRLVTAASSIIFLDELFVHYRQRSGSILHTDIKREIIFFEDGMHAFIERETYIAHKYPSLNRVCLLGTYRWLSAYAWDLAGRLGNTNEEKSLWFAIVKKLNEYARRCGIVGVPIRVLVKYVLVVTGTARLIKR